MINLDKRKPLNIYRASAGSGKTHRLTGFYIKLLFIDDLRPETHSGEMKFSEILAVTFTNKATAEMKNRIIDELYLLSKAPRESDYWEDLLNGVKPEKDFSALAREEAVEKTVLRKATRLLIQILNEYSQFNISTIDSFFQRIVRSFARELNIPGNYEVELDAERVLEVAVSNFLDKLDKKQDKALFDWMEDFSEKRIEEGSNWDFKTELLKLAKSVLTSEAYRQHSTAIREFTDDKKALREYAQMLEKMQREWRNELKKIGEEGETALEDSGLTPEDFSYGAKSPLFIFCKWAEGDEKLPTETFKRFANDPQTWFNKKSQYAKGLPQNTTQRLLQIMQRAVDHTSGLPYRNYMTARAIRAHFYELGILANIDKEVIEYCNDQNFMLLSSTTEMLSRLIDKDDAPFIYEKTGSKIHSYMIDEFQDTSCMQWGNFKPLVSNALGEGYQNLIVGDVKQSIYRWRGGDWNLLNSEINSYEPLLHHDDSVSLRTNWRSLPSIVEFNNCFFHLLAQKLDEMLGTDVIAPIYKDVEQQLPEKKKPKAPGLVHISYLQPKDADGNPISNPKKEDFLSVAFERLPEVVIKLQENGFRPKDIAILCRKNNECQWAAESLLKYKQDHPDCPYGMDIISGEALVIGIRPCIQAIISLMRHLLTPDSAILQVIAWTCYLQLDGTSNEDALQRYFAMKKEDRLFHPELANRPLYEMAEELIGLLPAEAKKTDEPFLQAFRDLVLEYAHVQSSDLAGFLDWWDEKGARRSISTPEGQDAILIMSIHKSKGLGMPAVIMPFASWSMDLDYTHNEIIWCEPKEEPFAREVLFPVKLEKSLADTIFAEEFLKERQCAVIDNLNTAYVAFTRAKEAMVLLTPEQKKEGSRLEWWLKSLPEELTEGRKDGVEDTENDSTCYTWGEWQRGEETLKKIKREREDTSLSVSTIEEKDSVSSTVTLPRITILHDPAKPDITAKERGTYIHAVLQHIRTSDEAGQVIHDLYRRGDIDPKCISESEMERTICKLLKRPDVAPWFRPGLTVLNELTLMDNEGNMQRPDRIILDESGLVTVIDYKTGSMHPGYKRQVRRYMEVLRSIGFNVTSGWLLFLKDGKTLKC